jgi:hypothetical protein
VPSRSVMKFIGIYCVQTPSLMSGQTSVPSDLHFSTGRAAPHHRSIRIFGRSSAPKCPISLLLVEEEFYRLAERLAANVLTTDPSARIEKINRRPCRYVPELRDRATGTSVTETAPVDGLVVQRLLQSLCARIAIDSDHHESFVFVLFHERPLVRVHAPAWPSPIAPEFQQDHFAPVIR